MLAGCFFGGRLCVFMEMCVRSSPPVLSKKKTIFIAFGDGVAATASANWNESLFIAYFGGRENMEGGRTLYRMIEKIRQLNRA